MSALVLAMMARIVPAGGERLAGDRQLEDAGGLRGGRVLTVGGMARTVDRSTERYHVTFTAETGANALPLATTITVSATWQRPAGSKVGQD